MSIEEIQERLKRQGIDVSPEDIESAGVSPSDIDERTLPLLVEHFQEQAKLSRKSEASLAVASTPTQSVRKKGGKLAKTKKGEVTPHAQTPIPATPIVRAEDVFENLQTEARTSTIDLIREAESSRLGLVDAVDGYLNTFTDRLWDDVGKRQQARPPRSREVVERAKEGWNEMMTEFRGELTEIGIELEA